jgi:hypothetical protein
MHNQHAGLSQVLAEQHITERREQAAHARLGVALVRRVAGVGRGRPVAGGSWPAGQASPPISQFIAPTAPVDRSEATLSKLAAHSCSRPR